MFENITKEMPASGSYKGQLLITQNI